MASRLVTALANLFTPKAAAPVETKTVVPFSYPPELFWDSNFRPITAASSYVSGPAAFKTAWLVYSCMKYRSTKLCEAPIWLVEEIDGEEQWLDSTIDHPLAELLERPNPDMEMADFLELLSFYLDSGGRALCVKSRDRGGRVGALYPFASDAFTVESSDTQLYGKFKVRTRKGEETLGPDDVLFFNEADPANPLGAVAPLDAALGHVNIGQSMRDAIRAVLRNRIAPGSWTSFPGEASQEEYERLKAQFRLIHEGVTQHGKNVIVEGGASFNVLPSALKDLALGDVQKDIEAAVCASFQVHPSVVGTRLGIEGASSWSDTIKSATTNFYDLYAYPRWNRISRTFTRGLLREVDSNKLRFIRFDTTKVRALQADMTARVTEAAGASAFWTKNEQRAHTNMPPLDDPAADQLTPPPAPPSTDGTPTPPDGDTTPPPKAALRAAFVKAMTPDALAARWALFDTKARADESAYVHAAHLRFNAERDSIVDRITSNVSASLGGTKMSPDDLARLRAEVADPYVQAALLKIAADYAPGGAYHDAWLQSYRALIAQTVKHGGDTLSTEVGFDFTLENPRARAAVQRRVTELAGNVTETTLQKLRDVLSKARAEGVGISEITKRIRDDVFGGEITTARAKTIATTETAGALNEGEHLAAIESGVLQSKRWLSQRVGNARQNHIEQEDAGWIGIHERYPIVGIDYPHAPGAPAKEVVSCRCGQVFDDRTPAEANAADGIVTRAAVEAIETAVARAIAATKETTPAPVERHVVHVTTEPEPRTPIAYRITHDGEGNSVVEPVIPSGAES